MDPDVTLARMCATNDDDERRELGLALEHWLVMGGFPPVAECCALLILAGGQFGALGLHGGGCDD